MGTTVSLPITVTNNPGFAAFSVNVTYDSSKLTLTGVTSGIAGSAFPNQFLLTTTPGNQRLLFANDGGATDFTQNGVIGYLNFTVAAGAPIGDTAVGIALGTGQVVNNANEEIIETTFIGGRVTISNVIPGDVNGDGIVNTLDLTRLARYLAGQNVEMDLTAADVTGDGTVNTLDLTRLARYLAGQNVTLG
jgi:hypothetical protein